MLRLVDDLWPDLDNAISGDFIQKSNGWYKAVAKIEFGMYQYYMDGKFLIIFYTYVSDCEDLYIESMNEYLFIIEDGKIIKQLYKNYKDEKGCYKEHEIYHMQLVKDKELEIVNVVNNVNEISLIFAPHDENSKIMTEFKKYKDFKQMPANN